MIYPETGYESSSHLASPTRSASGSNTRSHCRTNASGSGSTIVHKVDYTLNKDKSITKKIRACEREDIIDTEYKTGNIVLTVQAGLYEIMKLTIQRLYSNHPVENKRVVPKVTIEKSNNFETACTYTVFENDEKVYVVNLYHTQSKIMINGKREFDFFNNDMPLLFEIMHSLEEFYGKDILDRLNSLIKNTLFLMNQ